MSAVIVTRADLTHVRTLVEWAEWVLEEYPWLLTMDEEDELGIVKQWVEEKLNEDTNSRY